MLLGVFDAFLGGFVPLCCFWEGPPEIRGGRFGQGETHDRLDKEMGKGDMGKGDRHIFSFKDRLLFSMVLMIAILLMVPMLPVAEHEAG